MEGVTIMKPVPVYSKEFYVDVGHVDFTGKQKLSSFFLYFQDVATLHAENLGVGMKEMHEIHNSLWVLVKMRVHISRYPKWGERILVETWPEKPERFQFMRNFIVKDAEDNTIAEATSTWVIIDMDTRRLKVVESIYGTYPLASRNRPIDTKLGRFQPNGPLEIIYRRPVGYSDIDVNGHLNNTKYVDFIMDCFSLDDHRNFTIESVEINYKNEAFAGDTITLFKDKPNDGSGLIYVEGVNEEENKLIFKCQLKVSSSK